MRRHLPPPLQAPPQVGSRALQGCIFSFAQKRSLTRALCFSVTEEESFQTAGWKLVHMMITHFFVS